MVVEWHGRDYFASRRNTTNLESKDVMSEGGPADLLGILLP